jgi:hypothetical protein
MKPLPGEGETGRGFLKTDYALLLCKESGVWVEGRGMGFGF